jgi:FlaG/FlaF family flagellin (archaellin)
MKQIENNLNSEAVSPVIGVMLMLVVTVIIAAVVSGFAGNMGLDKKTGPNVVLSGPVLDFDSNATAGDVIEIKTYANYVNYPTRPEAWVQDASLSVRLPSTVNDQHGLTFTHMGGDPIDLKELQMEFSTGDLGAMVDYNSIRGQVQSKPFEPKYRVGDTFESDKGPRTVTRIAITYQGGGEAPYTLDELVELVNNKHFGYFVKIDPETDDDTIIRTGDQFKIYTDDTKGLPGQNWAIYCINDGHSTSMAIEEGTGNKWTLSHKPSGQILAQGDLNFPDTN